MDTTQSTGRREADVVMTSLWRRSEPEFNLLLGAQGFRRLNAKAAAGGANGRE